MTEGKTRTLELDGRRASVRLDPMTWQAIDLIAEEKGVKWAEWALDLIANNPDADNRHAVIRAAVMRELMEHHLFSERADEQYNPASGMLASQFVGTLDDDQLRDEQTAGTVNNGCIDLIGFSVQAGADMHGRACIWITNGLRDQRHFVIALPLTPTELAERMRKQP